MTGRTSRSLPEQDLARVALEQEGLRDEETVEHLDDVAVLQHELRPAAARMMAVPQRLRRLDDLELGERRTFDGLGAEEAHDRAPRPQDAHHLLRHRPRGGRL